MSTTTTGDAQALADLYRRATTGDLAVGAQASAAGDLRTEVRPRDASDRHGGLVALATAKAHDGEAREYVRGSMLSLAATFPLKPGERRDWTHEVDEVLAWVERENIGGIAAVWGRQDADTDGGPPTYRAVSVVDFASVHEDGAEPVLGKPGQIVLPMGGDLIHHGPGGGGKSTQAMDCAFHVAAGYDWLGMPVLEPRRVLIVENEGGSRSRSVWIRSNDSCSRVRIRSNACASIPISSFRRESTRSPKSPASIARAARWIRRSRRVVRMAITRPAPPPRRIAQSTAARICSRIIVIVGP